MESVQELVQFMQPNQRLDLKAVALTHVLALTGTAEGKSLILSLEDMLLALFGLTFDENMTVAKDALLTLINLTAEEEGAHRVFDCAKAAHPKFEIVQEAIKSITNADSQLADAWTMIFSNLTRVESLVPEILHECEKDDKSLLNVAKAFVRLDFNKKNQKLHYLGPIFCNLTQNHEARELFCKNKYNLLDKVLPFSCYQESVVRRGGVIGLLKNLCFDVTLHDKLLEENDDILQTILYPLCGPEEFTDEENNKFPIELQFLDDTKTREEDPDLRKMLLECLLQLCATKKYREHLREKGVYEILREYHKWEANFGKDSECLLACENVVDILIKKEEEIGLDNYKEVEVPKDVAEKFTEEDASYLKDLL